MSRIAVEVTNNRPQETYELPDIFGGVEIEPGGSHTVTIDSSEFNRLEHNDEADQLLALESVEADTDIDVSVWRSPSGGSGDLRDRMRNAVEPEGASTMWVGPDGDDSNPGTEDAPVANIQTAIDRLDDNHPVDERKVVHLKPGVYTEEVFINTRNLKIIGTPRSFLFDAQPAAIENTGGRPSIVMTNMTREGYENFQSDGGVDYSWNGTTFDYTGASLDRERRYSSADVSMGVEVVGVRIGHADPGTARVAGCLAMAAPGSSDEGNFSGVRFRDCFFLPSGFSSSNTLLYWKNFANEANGFENTQLVNLGSGLCFVLDTVQSVAATPGHAKLRALGDAVFHAGPDNDPDEGGIGTDADVFAATSWQMPVHGKASFVGRVVQAGPTATDIIKARDNGSGEFFWGSSGGIGESQESVGVSTDTFTYEGGSASSLRFVECVSATISGSGALRVSEIRATGNVTVSGGSGHSIHGGFVEGDLTINGGSDVTLDGVTVEGDVIVDDDNTTVTLNGCHVEGTLDVDSGNDNTGVSVTVSGGTVMNTNDPGTNITTETPAIG